jgi:hypothetical protein
MVLNRYQLVSQGLIFFPISIFYSDSLAGRKQKIDICRGVNRKLHVEHNGRGFCGKLNNNSVKKNWTEKRWPWIWKMFA